MEARIEVSQLAADVQQRLLAAAVDVEQRWQFLSAADRVEALTDLIAVAMSYQRAMADSATATELAALAVSKGASDACPVNDQAALNAVTSCGDAVALGDALASLCDFSRSFGDSAGVTDALETLLTLARSYSDELAVYDAVAKGVGKFAEDSGEPYVEADYFADDYWQAGGPTLRDALACDVGKPATDAVVMGDALARAFMAQTLSLVVTAEYLACTVDFTRAFTDAAGLIDAHAKTVTCGYSEVGWLYATADYFADDYVEAGTGPAVYDLFTFTLN